MQKRESFQERLVRLRKLKGFTQQELADATGISRRAIAHYETQGKEIPPQSAIVLAKALNVSVDELFGHKSSPKQDTISNRKLFKKMQAVEKLPKHAQKTVINIIEGLEAKHSHHKP